MKKLLVTAFDAFGGDETNASSIVLKKLPEKIGDVEIIKLVVPTVYKKCAEIAWQKAKDENAEAVLALGQAGGRCAITPEKRGVNYANAEMCDNAGVRLKSAKLCEGGEEEYFSTLPVQKMADAVKGCGVEAYVSDNAGGFVCNSMLYLLLKFASEDNCGVRCAFMHLPYASEQRKNGFSLESDIMAKCVEAAIDAAAGNTIIL
ncbi:MAG: pyroglutamyl-peptidase I [Clostridia bacterium]|nr:pyroglutamyl-peptidase I [Clostridia bacterium]